MDKQVILHKLQKYQTKLRSNPSNYIYQQKVTYYGHMSGGGEVGSLKVQIIYRHMLQILTTQEKFIKNILKNAQNASIGSYAILAGKDGLENILFDVSYDLIESNKYSYINPFEHLYMNIPYKYYYIYSFDAFIGGNISYLDDETYKGYKKYVIDLNKFYDEVKEVHINISNGFTLLYKKESKVVQKQRPYQPGDILYQSPIKVKDVKERPRKPSKLIQDTITLLLSQLNNQEYPRQITTYPPDIQQKLDARLASLQQAAKPKELPVRNQLSTTELFSGR
jgi:hypothetical protein